MRVLASEFAILPASCAAKIVGGEEIAPSGGGWLALPCGAWLIKRWYDVVDSWLDRSE